MTEDHPGPVPVRTRNLLHMHLDDEDDSFIDVDHVYLPEGEAGTCGHCDCDQPAHDPGMVGLAVSDGNAVLTAEQALVVANRLTRAANLIFESEESPADIERDMARFAAAKPEGGG